MRALSYFVEEAARSLWRRRAASILAAGTSAVSLLVLGLFLLAGSNASRILERWSATAELSVYLNESATPENRRTVAPSDLPSHPRPIAPSDRQSPRTPDPLAR